MVMEHLAVGNALQSEDARCEGAPEPDLGLGIAKRRDDRGPDAGEHGLVLQEMT